MHESKADGDTRYDIPGAVTATLGLVALVYGFTKVGELKPGTGVTGPGRGERLAVVRRPGRAT